MESKKVLGELLWWLDCHDQAKEDVLGYVGCEDEDLQSLSTCIVTNTKNLEHHIHFDCYKDGACNFHGSCDGWTELTLLFTLIDNISQELDMNVADIAEMYLDYKKIDEEEANDE
nr:MAG TPA: hypothetical protein [Bacteriophage sp.]